MPFLVLMAAWEIVHLNYLPTVLLLGRRKECSYLELTSCFHMFCSLTMFIPSFRNCPFTGIPACSSVMDKNPMMIPPEGPPALHCLLLGITLHFSCLMSPCHSLFCSSSQLHRSLVNSEMSGHSSGFCAVQCEHLQPSGSFISNFLWIYLQQ